MKQLLSKEKLTDVAKKAMGVASVVTAITSVTACDTLAALNDEFFFSGIAVDIKPDCEKTSEEIVYEVCSNDESRTGVYVQNKEHGIVANNYDATPLEHPGDSFTSENRGFAELTGRKYKSLYVQAVGNDSITCFVAGRDEDTDKVNNKWECAVESKSTPFTVVTAAGYPTMIACDGPVTFTLQE